MANRENLQPLLEDAATSDSSRTREKPSRASFLSPQHGNTYLHVHGDAAGSYQPPASPSPDSASQHQTFSQLNLHMSSNPAVLQPSTSVAPDEVKKYKPRFGRGDHYFLLSILLSIAFTVCLTWWALPCTLAGLCYSVKAQKASFHENFQSSEQFSKSSLYLNVSGIIVCVVSWLIIIIVLSVIL